VRPANTRDLAASPTELTRIFHESPAATADMDVLPGVLEWCTLRRTIQVRLGFGFGFRISDLGFLTTLMACILLVQILPLVL